MKALVHNGSGAIALTERPRPRIVEPTDAIVRVTLSSICTSDLHIIHGTVPRALPDTVLGHEFVGVVEEVGGAVRGFAPGMRVAVNVETFCGECFFCKRGYVNNCERGGWELGCRIDGCQAEYARVPLAEQGLTRIPDHVTDEQALLLGDILATGYFGAEIAEIKPGDAVAVIGAGPVGLCAMACARLYGAAQVIALDIDAERLAVAKREGLADVTINPAGQSPKAAAQGAELAVRDLTEGRGADAVIECAGGAGTFEMAWRVARPNAVVSVMALYEESQMLPLPLMYGKNLVFKTGGVDAHCLDRVMNLIAAGRLDTSFLITHRFPLNRIEEAYRLFAAHEDGCLKVAVTPWED
ncbi:alcohol dehydrogenase [Gordonibacter sp. An230]|uniref:alcohol dehydrogenase n=1 Tax=Gordonibacter sp. An230 TaxID=1965592 RepID=UPI00194F5071|nr:alcohol dehydrogenase [Gordonibacter sp. An230]